MEEFTPVLKEVEKRMDKLINQNDRAKRVV